MSQPDCKGFIGANTYRQLQNSTLSAMFNVLDECELPYTYNKNEGKLKIGPTEIICMSLENYNVIRGIEIGWFWLDEVRDTREEAFSVLMGRLRDKRALFYNGRLTSSPSGYNWLYDYFVGDKKTDEFELVQATSMDNPFLPDGYVETLKSNYDEKVFEQEVLGKFVNIQQGRVYYAFDRKENVTDLKINAGHSLFVGMDFNINPMTAIVCQYYNNTIFVIDEFFLMSSDTGEMAEAIKKKYGNRPVIIPDATGKALKTSSAGLSDHEILRRHGFRVQSTTNPFRGDRYNSVNNLLSKKRLKIDRSCVKLIKDLEQVSYKEGSTHPDVTHDKTLTHISDALGYAVWSLEPIRRPRLEPGLYKR